VGKLHQAEIGQGTVELYELDAQRTSVLAHNEHGLTRSTKCTSSRPRGWPLAQASVVVNDEPSVWSVRYSWNTGNARSRRVVSER
jgi:hypothetical protein